MKKVKNKSTVSLISVYIQSWLFFLFSIVRKMMNSLKESSTITDLSNVYKIAFGRQWL